MARYDYLCGACGVFEVVRPIGAAAGQQRCPACGHRAARIFTPPALISPNSPLRRAREEADRSAHEPSVRSRPPSLPHWRARPPNPLHAKLPRP